jgi:putative ABC transport system permease protein
MISELIIMQGIIERGIIFSLCVIALYLSSRIIRFDDLSLEGSFGLGGAITALALSNNVAWYCTIPIVIVGGACAGLATGLLHTKLKLNNLISGIVVTTGLFSINLKIGGANMMLNRAHTIFSLLPTSYVHLKVFILAPVIIAIIIGLKWFLSTECGFLLRAVGDNPQMLINLSKNPDKYVTAMLMISNAITSLAGSLFVQYAGYFSIWASVGILITSLAGLILSETISTSFGSALIVGSILYQTIIALTFECNIDPEWNKLITALLIVGMITFKQFGTSLYRKSS